MSEKNAEKNAENTEKKAPAPKVEIIRGRMPLPIVAMIKFGDHGTDGQAAAKFRTTNGKVSDVRKEANFGYVTKEYAPSASDLEKACAYAEQLEDKSVLKTLQGMKPATEEQTAAFDATRKASRKTTAKPTAAPEDVSEEDLEELTD